MTDNKKTLNYTVQKVYNELKLRKDKTMKKILYILFVGLFLSTGLAYTYEVYTYSSSKNLKNNESILIAEEGGMDSLYLTDSSNATIIGTSTLSEGFGGIWFLSLSGNSNLDMFGGEVHQLTMNNYANAELRGGVIESIYSYQIVPDPHITLYYSGTIPTVQTIGGFNYLVGNWGNGDPFSIYLHDTGYNAYGNFEFILIPEPATLFLIAFGGLLLRRR